MGMEWRERMAKKKKAPDQFALIAQGLNQLPQGITIFDDQLQLVAWNDAAIDVLELPDEFAKEGTHIGDVFRYNAERGEYGEGDVEEQVASRVAIAAKFEPHKFERTLLSGRIIEVDGTPLPTGGFVTTYTDITETRTTEIALRMSRELLDQRVAARTIELEMARDELSSKSLLLQSTLDNVIQGISLFDSNLDALVLNKRFQELLGFPDELMKPHTNLAEFFRFNAERGEYGEGDVEEQVRERIELAKKFEPHRFRRERPDGSVIEVVGLPFEAGGFVTTYEDVTVQVNAERSIQQASQAKSDFLAKMSHELRTPLNSIIGLSEMLHEDAAEDNDEHYEEPLRRILGSGQHLLAVINDILDLSKIEAGKVEMSFEKTCLSQLVDQIHSTVKPLAERNDNKLSIELGNAPKYIKTDPLRLRQILLNLLGNAVKFTESGEIKLLLSSCQEEGAEQVLFIIEDDGLGIPADRLDDLFSEFSQVPSGRTRSQDGTGLGLAICKKTVEMMGGTIGAESQEDVGSWFWFKLPIE